MYDAKKLLKFCHVLWGWQCLDFCTLCRVWINSVGIIDHAEELDLWCFDFAFINVEHESTFLCNLHDIIEVFVVVLFIFSVDDDVVCDADGARALA